MAEGEGFETTRREAADRATKSRTIPLELVQSVWRKIHSPSRFEELFDQAPGFSRAKILVKQRDFGGSKNPKDQRSRNVVAEGEELGSNLLRVA